MVGVPRRCVMCGGTKGVRLWTIDNLHKVVATYLCKEDAAPLLAIMDIAGDLPPGKQVPVPDREEPKPDFYKRGRRNVPMTALEWIPPTPPELHAGVESEENVPD